MSAASHEAKSALSTERSRRENVRPSIRSGLRRAWGDRELLLNFVQRDLRARYRRSVLGWGWSMINPASTAIVYTFVFTVIFKVQPQRGDPSGLRVYALLLLGGLLPWSFMQGGVNAGIGALLGGSGMLQKVYFAREHLVAGAVYALLVSFLIELSVLGLLDLLWGHFAFHLAPVVLFLVFLLSLFTLGLSLFFAAMNLRYRDVQHLTSVFFLVWSFLTPIVYPPQLIPDHYPIFGRSFPLRDVFMLNPMARFVQAFRNCLYDIRLPGFNTLASLTVISVVTFFAGYRYFIRRAPWFVEDL